MFTNVKLSTNGDSVIFNFKLFEVSFCFANSTLVNWTASLFTVLLFL